MSADVPDQVIQEEVEDYTAQKEEALRNEAADK
jgi:hypothetical protein